MKRQFRIFFNPSILFLIGLLLILPISLSVMLTAFVFANEPTDPLSNPSVARHIPAAESISLPDEQRITHYDIFVRLDEQRNMLDGSLSLLWQHPGEQPVDTLYFHLYPNAFSSENTTFMRESGGKLRNDQAHEDSIGHLDIAQISVNGIDMQERIEFVQPDDGNEHDQTVLKLTLTEPLERSDTARIDFQFSVKLPYVFARMGYADDFVMAGQWFPKIGVYEPKGLRGRVEEGWNIHQYHGNSEFYANFGSYRVRIDVPAEYTVAATGVRQHKRQLDGRTLHEFAADAVHDFAWSASPNFIEKSGSIEQADGEYVNIQLYLDPKHEHLENRYMRAAKESLIKYSEWFGPYPYPTLSVVVPPAGAGGAAGMEYPTLITAWEAEQDSPGYELERVIAHEIGHQYFYGLVANNEFEEAWLDEAFTSYAEDRLMKEVYHQIPVPGLEAVYVTDPAPLHWYAWHYADHDHYADNVYIRGKLVLKEIEKKIGIETMNDVLSAYVGKYKFGHPTTTDFKAVLEETTEQNWDAFFNTFVYEGGMTDYELTQIDTQPLELSERASQAKASPEEGNVHPQYRHQLQIAKYGAEVAKLPILIRFADGTKELHLVDGVHDKITLSLEHTAKIDWAVIDPYFTLTLEHVRTNNFLRNNVTPNDQAKWNLTAVQIAEVMLQAFAW